MFANKWQQLSKQTGGVLRYDNFPYNIVLKPSVPDVNSGCISGARYFLKYKHKSTGHMEKGTSWEIPPHIVSVQKISNSTSLFKITPPPRHIIFHTLVISKLPVHFFLTLLSLLTFSYHRRSHHME